MLVDATYLGSSLPREYTPDHIDLGIPGAPQFSCSLTRSGEIDPCTSFWIFIKEDFVLTFTVETFFLTFTVETTFTVGLLKPKNERG